MTLKVLSVALALAVLSLGGVALGQENPADQLPNPGITPDSPFYFLDKWGKGISLAFTFSAKGKAEKRLRFAEERLAEARQMAEEGKAEDAEKAVGEYGRLVSKAAQGLASAAQNGEGFDEALANLVERATSIHLSVLSEVRERVPEQAKAAIDRAISESSRGQSEALNALNRADLPEEARRRVDEARTKVDQQLNDLRSRGVPVPSLPAPGVPGTRPAFPGEGIVPEGVVPESPGGAPGDVKAGPPRGAVPESPGGPPSNLPGGRP